MNTDLGIKNDEQGCKIVLVGGWVLVGAGR
jgi:hypothetical protein